MTITDARRAKRLASVLRQFGEGDTAQDALIDLLVDSRHWCDRHAECHGELDRFAHSHYLMKLLNE